MHEKDFEPSTSTTKDAQERVPVLELRIKTILEF